jgi:hypothetical protein
MQQMDDEIVLVNLNTNHFYSLNRTATRFWELLCDGNQVATIEEKLLSEFDIDAVTLRSEIDTHLAQLTEKGLVCHADN